MSSLLWSQTILAARAARECVKGHARLRSGACRSLTWEARSSGAGAARAWSSGASRWRARSGPPSATRSTGAGRCRASAIPDARVVVLGLAPAAHGGNRTGRVFTGDRSGDWLFASLHRAGFANQPTSIAPDDGLRLHGAFVAAAVRCAPPANKPLPSERDTCLPYSAEELELLRPARDRAAWARSPGTPPAGCTRAAARGRASATAPSTRPTDGPVLLGSYHPSQQNTFTGKLTEPMLDAVFAGRASSPKALLRCRARKEP